MVTSPPSLLTQIKACLLEGLDAFQASGGVGADAYWQELTVHPMAEAKMLDTAVLLHKSNIVTQGWLAKFARGSLARLSDTAQAIGPAENTAAVWGLNFPWPAHEATAQEPFLITSACICGALARLKAVGVNTTRLSERAADGLDYWCREETAELHGLPVPVYGLNVYRVPVLNTILASFAALQAANRPVSVCDAFLEHAWGDYHEGIGWDYDPNRPVIDLLHQWYVMRSFAELRGYDGLSERAMSVMGQLATPNGWIDGVHRRGAAFIENDNLAYIRRNVGAHWLLIYPKPARLWSLGEMLLGVCELIPKTDGVTRDFWDRQSGILADEVLRRLRATDELENTFYRHTSHALHGLAAFLAMRRAKP
ncbi:hypothetical protein [Robiginitomaculum antarcticum]|uniref:hypothetical protein n=1 Tax=Robiginitomaculum antarcticum TaxID=437507 RepID=UPI0003820B2E|nr:hypothetical protein [Robiginitomaculum antarcticum]